MFAFASVIGSQEKFRRCAAAGIGRVSEPDAVVAEYTDAASMCVAYNEVLDAFAQRDDLEALVLLHDDTEILDREFCAKVRRRLADDDVAVLGVVGARGVRSLEWWNAETRGRVMETRGHIDFGGHDDDVDAVDGLLLVLSPWAVRNLRFDAARFDAFHGYDVDFCLQARAAGRRVVVGDIEIFHHTKGGLGDEDAFRRADAAFRAKWQAAAAARRAEPCTVCATDVAADVPDGGRAIVACPSCGTGISVPAPDRDAESDGIWVEQYGGGRMANRDQWFAEAAVRVDWVARHAAGGLLVDVGGGTGELAAVAAQRGFASALVEPSAWAAGQARELGVERVLSDVADWPAAFGAERADVVTLFHVIEHVHDARAFLAAVREILRPGGALFVEVPNFGAEDAQRDAVAWTGTAIDDHVAHYTPSSLARLVGEAGFEVVEALPLPTMVYDKPDYWSAKCERWRALGMVRPSDDLLRLRATA